MSNNWAPLVADLFLFCEEVLMLFKPLTRHQDGWMKTFTNHANSPYFEQMVSILN